MERLKEIPVLMNEEWSLSAALDDYYKQQRKKKKKKVKREGRQQGWVAQKNRKR